MSIKSVDDLLNTSNDKSPIDISIEPQKIEDSPDDQAASQEIEIDDTESQNEEAEGSALEGESTETEPEVDDYGHEIPKARMYTEEEVQKMIRDRLSRGSASHHATNAEVKKAAENFEADPNNPESWEAQLEQFIDKTLEKKQNRMQRKSAEKQELARQAEFETKFNSGMEKYKDFRDVVSGKPITDAMMLAARNMKDPAAFIYAAAKTQAKELERIAKIPDAYAQALEIGKLDERMRKTRSANSSAPPPVKHATGDITQKVATRPSIDARIHQYGKKRFTR